MHSLFFRISISIIYISLFISISFTTDTMKVDSAILPLQDIPDTEKITIVSPPENILESVFEDDILDAQMSEAKYIFAEAIISDLTGDTLEAAYQFELLLKL